jgi:hypothetical protein
VIVLGVSPELAQQMYDWATDPEFVALLAKAKESIR